jgi:predicted small secreted protein
MFMNTRALIALVIVGAFALGACRNTYNGVKADTHKAVHKTGHAVERTGEKIEGK